MATKDNTQHATLWAALAAAQGEFKPVKMSGKNPHFKSTYSTLSDMRDATAEALARHGIVVYQAPTMQADGLVLRSVLRHADSDQEVTDKLPLPNTANMQTLGSAITYARRYLYAAQLCLAAGDDDDGQLVSETAQKPATPRKKAAGSAVPQNGNGGPETPLYDGMEPSQDEREFLKRHATPEKLQAWALSTGTCKHEQEASNAWLKQQKFVVGNKPLVKGSDEYMVVCLRFYRRQLEKLEEVQEALWENTQQAKDTD